MRDEKRKSQEDFLSSLYSDAIESFFLRTTTFLTDDIYLKIISCGFPTVEFVVIPKKINDSLCLLNNTCSFGVWKNGNFSMHDQLPSTKTRVVIVNEPAIHFNVLLEIGDKDIAKMLLALNKIESIRPSEASKRYFF